MLILYDDKFQMKQNGNEQFDKSGQVDKVCLNFIIIIYKIVLLDTTTDLWIFIDIWFSYENTLYDYNIFDDFFIWYMNLYEIIIWWFLHETGFHMKHNLQGTLWQESSWL